MPVIQGGGVTYDAGAAVRDNFKDLTNSMQILATLKQEERKHQLNVLDKAAQLVQFAQQASGLPMQVFLGTELATEPLNAMFQAYSAASGRKLTGDEAQQIVNMLQEYNADQKNWSKGTFTQFVLSRSSDVGQMAKGSGTATPTQGQNAPEQAPPSTGGGTPLASPAASATGINIKPSERPIVTPPPPSTPPTTPSSVGAPIGTPLPGNAGIERPVFTPTPAPTPAPTPQPVMTTPAPAASVPTTTAPAPLPGNAGMERPTFTAPTKAQQTSAATQQTSEQVVSTIKQQFGEMAKELRAYAKEKGISIPANIKTDEELIDWAQKYAPSGNTTLFGEFIINTGTSSGKNPKDIAQILRDVGYGAKAGVDTFANGIRSTATNIGTLGRLGITAASGLTAWLLLKGYNPADLMKLLVPSASGSEEYQDFQRRMMQNSIALAQGPGGATSDVGRQYNAPSSNDLMLLMYQQAFPEENFRTIDDVTQFLAKYPYKKLPVTFTPSETTPAPTTTPTTTTTPVNVSSVEIPTSDGKKVVVTEDKVAKAPTINAVLAPSKVGSGYTGPKASEEAMRIAKDPIKVSNIFEKLRSVTGQPTKSFKEKSEVHNAAVTAGNWLQTGWNVMTPQERLNVLKRVQEEVESTNPNIGYFSYGSDWATIQANQLRDEAQLQAAIASQMSVQASVQAAGLSGLLRGIVDLAQTYASVTGDISVAAINKGKSPSEYLANPKENPAYVGIQDDIRKILDTFFQAGGMDALLGAVKTYQLQGGFLGIGKKYKPAPGTTEGTTLTPEQKAAQEKAAEEAKRIINGR